MKLQPAQDIADEIIQALRPECAETQVAGSIRRLMPDVKDVEIVYISHTSSQQMDLFGTHFQTYFHANHAIAKLIGNGTLVKDTTVKRWGTKYKRAIHCASGIVVEMFRAQSDNWGYILALRTGPAAFNKLLVTRRSQGSALPPDIKLQGGYVWHIGRSNIQTQIPTPTERGFFVLLDLPFIPPQERTVKRLRRCIQDRNQ